MLKSEIEEPKIFGTKIFETEVFETEIQKIKFQKSKYYYLIIYEHQERTKLEN